MRDLETFLHGHLPATGPDTGLVLIACDRRARPRVTRPRPDAAAGLRAVGIRCAAITHRRPRRSWRRPGDRPAPAADGLPAAAAALLGAAAPLQLLTLELALARGTNPDLIRREQAPYRAAARSSRAA